MTQKLDIYTRVTNKIIADLEAGVRTWHQPWNAEHLAGRITRPLRHNGIGSRGRGLNIILLWSASVASSYTAPIWMTYRQAQQLGGQVRKGSKGETVVYADKLRKTETDDNGQEREVAIPFMKGYTVFNVEQIDGLPEHYYATAQQIPEGIERDEDAQAYYATLAHEVTHWTRHRSRLDRDFGRKKWGDEGYAQEELVAELGAAFLAADLGLTPEPRDEHAAYIASWLKALKNDKRFIFQAASHAQRAVDYLHGCQPLIDEEDEVAA